MTNLKKPVRRETNRLIKDGGRIRPIIITLHPPGLLEFRQKGCRRKYSITAEDCYKQAVKIHVAAAKKAKKKKK